MVTELNAASRLRATVHNIFPRGGGALWRITPPNERRLVLEKFPERKADLHLDAPYEVRPVGVDTGRLRVSQGIRPRRSSYLERSLPQED